MGLYTLSEFITTVKEDVGIKDLPLPVSDQEILDRFNRSALTDFSILHPRVETLMMNDNERLTDASMYTSRFSKYRIPKWIYDGTVVLDVTRVEISRPNGCADYYMPNGGWASPDSIISASADMRMAAGLAASMSKAPTHQFRSPDIIEVYNGWSGGTYEVELLLKHDLSLVTIQPGAFIQLRELSVLDMKAYLYNQLKRKDRLDVGIGSIDIKIDDWASADADRIALLKSWSEDGATLDYDHIKYF